MRNVKNSVFGTPKERRAESLRKKIVYLENKIDRIKKSGSLEELREVDSLEEEVKTAYHNLECIDDEV